MKSFSFENIILFLAGAAITIVVSFIFFRLQEKRATTAHKERIDRANSEAMRSYVKLLLQFDNGLKAEDLQCIDFSVAKEFNINRAELSKSRVIFDTAIGLILQSDFIRREEKENLIKSQQVADLRAALTEASHDAGSVPTSDVSISVAGPISLAASSVGSIAIAYYIYHALEVKSFLETIVIALAALFIFMFSFVVLFFMLDEYWLSKIINDKKDKRIVTVRNSKENVIDADFREVDNSEEKSH